VCAQFPVRLGSTARRRRRRLPSAVRWRGIVEGLHDGGRADGETPAWQPPIPRTCRGQRGGACHSVPSVPRCAPGPLRLSHPSVAHPVRTAPCKGGACPSGREKKGSVMPTETNNHGDALCFMVKTWARHKTTETVLNNGGRLAVGGPWGLSLIKNNWGFFRTALRKQGVARPPQQGTP